MNSRSAKNDTKRNSTITPALPKTNARPITRTITHQARMRAFRLSIAPCGWSGALRLLSRKPTTDASTSVAPMLAKIASVSCGAVMILGECLVQRRHQRQQRVARAIEKTRLVFIGLDLQWRTDRQRAQQRYRHEPALGHHPARILDPDRDEIDLRTASRQMIDPALEREERRIGHVPGAFRKDDQRVAGLDGHDHRPDGALGMGPPAALDEHRADEVVGNVTLDARLAPIIRTGHRTRTRPQVRRQTRPEQREVAVAGMVRIV